MSDLSILATELPSDPNASTFVADDLGKEHEGVSKSTMEQVNDSSYVEHFTPLVDAG